MMNTLQIERMLKVIENLSYNLKIPKKRGEYAKITNKQRKTLIAKAAELNSIKDACTELGINYSTGKTILTIYQRSGRIHTKHTKNRKRVDNMISSIENECDKKRKLDENEEGEVPELGQKNSSQTGGCVETSPYINRHISNFQPSEKLEEEYKVQPKFDFHFYTNKIMQNYLFSHYTLANQIYYC